MTDPYRQAAYRCIWCEDAPLRELMGGRLVCQGCNGVLLEREDLEQAIADMTSDLPELVDEGPLVTTCPRCPQLLTYCRLRVGTQLFDARLVRCADHGVWFDAIQLVNLFEWLGRESHSGSGRGSGKYYGGVGDVLILHGRRAKPRVRTPQYATQREQLPCPVCASAVLAFTAGRWNCAGCRGVFVEDPALATMIAEMTGNPWEPPAPTNVEEGARPCPVCTAGMIEEQLLGVPIERCPGHGVWFDGDELAAALLRSMP